jgi:hypothetical protein
MCRVLLLVKDIYPPLRRTDGVAGNASEDLLHSQVLPVCPSSAPSPDPRNMLAQWGNSMDLDPWSDFPLASGS